nr:MAG TPA: hypothetical protein [Caudoviricetes sp.]
MRSMVVGVLLLFTYKKATITVTSIHLAAFNSQA